MNWAVSKSIFVQVVPTTYPGLSSGPIIGVFELLQAESLRNWTRVSQCAVAVLGVPLQLQPGHEDPVTGGSSPAYNRGYRAERKPESIQLGGVSLPLPRHRATGPDHPTGIGGTHLTDGAQTGSAQAF